MKKALLFLVGSFTLLSTLTFAQDFTSDDYDKALWMTTRFYGGQRSTDINHTEQQNNWLIQDYLPSGVPANKTGISFAQDADAGHDLSGGWFDCGDHVFFGQTGFYAGYMLLKAYDAFPEGYDDYYDEAYSGYRSSGDYSWEGGKGNPNGIPDVLDEAKHQTDFFIKAAKNSTTFYFEKGDGDWDHMERITSVLMQTNPQGTGGEPRPMWSNPNGASMASMCSATLALMSRLYRPFDEAYADLCLVHAKYAYDYASSKSGSVGAASGSFYNGNDNWKNGKAIMLAEMYMATGQATYKSQADAMSTDSGNGGDVHPNAGYTFDYSNTGEIALYALAEIGHSTALGHFNDRITGSFIAGSNYNGQGAYSNGGGWGKLRYVGNAALLVALYDQINGNSTLNARVYDNVDYIMGSNSGNQSYIVGFRADNSYSAAEQAHHRNAYLYEGNNNNANVPLPTKNEQLGALVGGALDGTYVNSWNDYVNTEVCVDYNVGIVGALGAIKSRLAAVDTTKFGANGIEVTLNSPASGTTLTEGDNVSLSATATTEEGTITKVEFYLNGTLVSTDNSSPYSGSISGISAGNHSIYAIAYNSNGDDRKSVTSNIVVYKAVPKTPNAIVIDGDVESVWGAASADEATKVISGTVSDANDLSASFKTLWDDTYLYVLAEVTDDSKNNNSTAIYEDDGIELYVDINNDKANSYGGDDYQYLFRYNDATVYESASGNTSGVVFAQTDVVGGYVMEVAIPWSTLGLSGPSEGELIGFEFQVNDDDAGDDARDAKISWAAPSDDAWQNPSLFGTVILSGSTGPACPNINLGADQSICGLSSILLETQVATDGVKTFEWFKDGSSLGSPSTAANTYNATSAGTYMVRIDSIGECSSLDQVVIGGTLPAVDLGSDMNLCSPSFAVLDAGVTGAGIDYAWRKDGALMSTSTGREITVTNPGTYEVTISASGCTSESDQVTITAQTSEVVNDTICASGSATLSVVGSGNYTWFANETGGASLASGNTYSPSVSATTTYWVEDNSSFNGSVGPSTSLPGDGTNWGHNADNRLVFTPTKDFTINSLKVKYVSTHGAQSAAVITLSVYDNTGTKIADFDSDPTVVPASGSSVLVEYTFTDFDIQASWGADLQLGWGATTANYGNPGWDASGASYPYSSSPSGVVDITGVTAQGADAYHYFYDWQISAGVSCDRVPVVAHIDPSNPSCASPSCTDPVSATLAADKTSPVCDETVTLTATAGATGTFNYEFFKDGVSMGAASANNTVVANASGSYTVEITDPADVATCAAVSAAELVTINAVPTANITTTDLAYCAGDGGVTLDGQTITGATYLWSSGETTASIANKTAGTYDVTVTKDGCSATSISVTVVENALPTVDAGTNQEICEGISVTLSGSGADVYAWDNSVTDGVAFTPSVGIVTYTVTGTDANGCVNADQVDLTVNALPVVDVGTNQEICEGASVTLSGSGADVYAWDNGVTDGVGFTPSVGTVTYTVTGTDANGCENTDQVDVTVNALPSANITTSGAALVYCGTGATLTAEDAGAGAIYSWNGPVTGSGMTLANATAGIYTVEVTSVEGCLAISSSVTVTEDCSVACTAPSLAVSSATLEICEGGDAVISGTVSGTPQIGYLLDIEKDGVPVVSGIPVMGGTFDLPITGATLTDAGDYTFIVEDGSTGDALCISSIDVTVTVNALPIVDAGTNQEVCEGTSVTLSGSGADVYAWDNGITDGVAFTPSVGTMTYTVTGTDANGCANTDQVDVTMNALPVVDAGTNQEVCEGTSVTLSGSGADVYVWDNGVTDGVGFTPSVGTVRYTVTGTDANGCANTDQVDVTVNAIPTANITSTELEYCDGDGGVTLEAEVVSGATYLWSTGETTVSISNATAGVYDLIVTKDGCSETSLVDVVAHPLPTVDAGLDQVVCEGEEVILSATTSVGALISWDNGVVDGNLFTPSLGLQTYSVTVVNAEGCTATDDVTVSVNEVPVANITSTDLAYCEGESGVTLTAEAIAGATYLWSSGETTASISNVNAGAYDVTVTKDGCSSTSTSVSVAETPSPTANITSTELTYCSDESGVSLDAELVSGATYLWSNGATSTSLVNATAGTYDVAVSKDGCTSVSSSVTVSAVLVPSTIITSTALSYCTGDAGVTLEAQNEAGASYLWSTGETSTSITNVMAGDYEVTVTKDGCSSTSANVTVSEVSQPEATVVASTLSYCEGDAGITLSAVSVPGATYTWSNGLGLGQTQNNVSEGSYAVTVQVGSCATVSDEVTVSEISGSAVSATASSTSYCSADFGVTLTGADLPGATYSWDNGLGNGREKNFVTAGTYTLTVSLAGCSFDATPITVTEKPSPEATILNGKTRYCENTSGLTLEAQEVAGATYAWSSGESSRIINDVTEGTYTVTVTLDGCSRTSFTRNITALAAPMTSAINGLDSLCTEQNASASYNVDFTAGSFYTWSTTGALTILSGEGGSNIRVDFNDENKVKEFISVQETNVDGCVGELVELEVTLDCGTVINGVNEFGKSSVRIYPNPFLSQLNIEIPSGLDVERITVTNESGEIVLDGSTVESLDFSTLDIGMYLIQINTTRGVITDKVVKLN